MRCTSRNALLPLRFLFCAMMFLTPFSVRAADAPRERLPFNDGWKFVKGDPTNTGDELRYAKIKDLLTTTMGHDLLRVPEPTATPRADFGSDVVYTQPDFDDSAWRSLSLPHDWGIEGPFDQKFPGESGKLPWWGVGWYRKTFDLPAADTDKRIYLDVDGAMSYSTVWVNGKFVGGWPYGYSSYRLDLTAYIKPGTANLVAIRIDNPPDSSRWYPGGGIYRNVWLVKTGSVAFSHWGTSITTPQVAAESASVEVRGTIENHTAADAQVTMRGELFELSPEGKPAGNAVAALTPVNVRVPAGESDVGRIYATIAHPKLWGVDSPTRYVAVTTIEAAGEVIDRSETPFGVRTIAFTTDNGFLLNGKRVPINGVCNHHDLGALGAAINVRAIERQIELLKEMGVNAIRTSHNPPAPELLDLCDRMGILVMDEFADTWKVAKKPNGYALLFDDWHERDLRAMVRRDRNHPSVILWSIGNEVGEQRRLPEGHERARMLTGIVHDEDSTRLTGTGCDQPVSGYNGFQNTVGVFGYNYKPQEYAKFRKANPTIPLIGSETASTVSSRGEYFFPVTDQKDQGKSDFQVSSYDLYAPRWASPPDWEFKGQDENTFVAGEFVWTGFDYLGEPTPYNSDMTILTNFSTAEEKARMEVELKEIGKIRVPSRSSYFGILDLAGFRKDRFYIYQARWRPDLPMAHILPHWNWPERVGQVTPVHVYTSGDEAELFLNGKTLGRQVRKPGQYRFRWDEVKYEPGELKVVTYKAGKPWIDEIVHTTGAAAKLDLKADRSTITADGSDLSYITLRVADENGVTVPRSKNRINFEITGPAEIVATDNGDATSQTPFQTNEKEAYNGLCLAIIRSTAGKAGPVVVTAASDGLAPAKVELLMQLPK